MPRANRFGNISDVEIGVYVKYKNDHTGASTLVWSLFLVVLPENDDSNQVLFWKPGSESPPHVFLRTERMICLTLV